MRIDFHGSGKDAPCRALLLCLLFAPWLIQCKTLSATRSAPAKAGISEVKAQDFIAQQTLLIADEGSKRSRVCTATLIHERFALTAAHCVYENPGKVTLLLGQGFRKTAQRLEGRALRHPDFRRDIAIIALSTPFPDFIDMKARLGRGESGDLKVGSEPLFAGFDSDSPSPSGMASQEPRLHQGRAQISSLEGGLIYVQSETGSACYGDGGGPLFIEKGEDFVLLGLMQASIDASRCRSGGVYTQTPVLKEWIDEAILQFPARYEEQRAMAVPRQFYQISGGFCIDNQDVDVYSGISLEGYSEGLCPETIDVQGQKAHHLGYVSIPEGGFYTHIYSYILGDQGEIQAIDAKMAPLRVDAFKEGRPPTKP